MPKPLVAFSLAALLSLPGAGQAPDARFSERAFVTAIDVITEVRDARGETPADLTPWDFRLLENGVERKIIAVEYLDPPPRPAPGTRPAPAQPGEAPRPEWQIVVWFDAMTMSRATLTRSARELGERAPDLLRFGPVTVVHSDIAAEVLVDATRDPRGLERALETLMQRPAGDRIAKIRREFLAAADAVTEATVGGSGPVIKMGAVDRQIPGYVAEEERLLGIARTNLFRWLERIPRRMPRMLVYVGDGFDLDPTSFYIDVLQASGDATVDVNQLRSEIKTKTAEASDELARRLAVGGWTALTIGGRNTNFSQDVTRGPLSGRQTGVPAPFLFMNPGDPLIQLAEETGGERIADAGALPGALADLGRRVRITYQVSREPDPRPRQVEIVPLRAGLTVRAPEWVSSTTTEGVAEARAIDLLTGGSARGDLDIGAALLPAGESGTPAIEARVDFGQLSGAAQQIGPTKLRMTVAIELPGEPAVTFHRIVDVADLAAVPGIVWTAPIALPERAGSVAVVAEELTTGSWGGARVGDPGAGTPAVAATPAVPSSTSFAPAPRLSRTEAFARAAAERKLALAFEWDENCRPCGAIYDRARGNPEVARRMGAFVVVGPEPSDPPAEARVALYDPSGRLFLSWPAIGYQRPGQPLSPGDLTVILQRAAAATPHLLRAHDLLADGEEIDARLAVAFAYQDAGDAARAEREYAEAARVATARGDKAKAQSARVLGSLMAANQGRADDAVKELRAIAASPATPLNEAEAHLVTAMILRAQSRDKEAAALLERVLALAPKDSAAHQAALTLAGGPGVAALAAEGAVRPLQLVIGGKPPYSGKTRFQVIVRDPAVSSVAFRADDGKEIADPAPPFEATIDLGATPRRREIRAVARDARGTVLAEDAIVLNERHDEFWVRLRPVAGSDLIGVETNIPSGSRIARVEFFVDGRPAAPLSPKEPAIRLPASEDGVVVRALATLEDGRTAEDAMLAGGHGFAETIEARDVEIYASVLDSSGKPLSGLDRSQFTIEENGRRKRVGGFEFLGRAPIAVGIAIDSSSSMLEAMPDVHRSARAFLELATRQGSSAFVVDFDTSPRLAAARTSNLLLLHAAVSRIRADGSTALYDAMIFGLLQLQGVPGKRALIVLSDGRDVTSRYGLKDAIAVARESGVAIYAIILSERRGPPVPGRMSPAPTGSAGGSGAPPPAPGGVYSMRRDTRGADPQIEKIAVESGGRAWYLPEAANMDAIYREIDLELRNQYRLTYRTAPGRGATDWRAVNVTVDVPGATVRTAAGFVAR